MDTYLTISKKSEGLYKEKGSRFISFALPISSLDEIKSILETTRKEFHDARHVCYAYIIGPEGKEFRANDDGEPSGTAGKPMLGVLLSNKLTNTLLIVVRYFGGTKLGTSGLINAYREACADAISSNEIIQKTVDESIKIVFEYPFLNDVMKIIKEDNPAIISQDFDNDCTMELSIRKRDFSRLKERLNKVDSLRIIEKEG